ncbi:MAG: hypothetical protein GF317_09560 [Candidatus Lokiarchaeota archaeon]|nr:hypothetical protein [Candidatus Lokiarchaeota archaeon]MBD3199958.1 hypothetical protein [Candidatus Lokiarchaeota archaeon]
MGRKKEKFFCSKDPGRPCVEPKRPDMFSENGGEEIRGFEEDDGIRSSHITKRENIEKMESMIDEEGRYSAESMRVSRAKFDLSEFDRLTDRSRVLANDTL